MTKLSLFQKITLSLVGLTFIGSLLLVVVLFTVYDHFELAVLDRTAEHDLDLFVTLTESSPASIPNIQDRLFYLVQNGQTPSLPTSLQTLEPGFYHEIEIADRDYHIAVKDVEQGRAYLALDIQAIEDTEDFTFYIFVTGIVLISLLTATTAAVIARRVVNPVGKLARQVQNLDPGKRKTRIADRYKDHEVSIIAQAFDRFFIRLDDYVTREQSFTAAASHEFRTPLAVILTSVEILETENKISDLSQKSLEKIKRATLQMSELINTLLFLARETNVEPGTVITENTNLSELLSWIIEEQAPLVENDSIELKTDIAPDITVPASESHLRIIINNLINNAAAHTAEGSIHVMLDHEKLEISDTGRGIEADEIEYIFEKDFSRHYLQGIGFGLYICKQICDRYHWGIDVKSQPGEGSRFTVLFKPVQA